MSRKHVAVLMGGMSPEHEVSISSGRMVVASLDQARYEVTPVVITQEGQWVFGDEAPVSLYSAIPQLKVRAIDCVFLALHGPFGEDGRIQGLLDLLGLPYTSSGCAASAISMDKIRCKAVVREMDVPVAKHVVLHRKVWESDPAGVVQGIGGSLGFSCVIKSPCQGSSLGMAICATAEDFPADVEQVFGFGEEVMIEEFIPGIELTCGVLDIDPKTGPRALPVTQILPITSSYFDYDAKYTPGATEEITPADIPPELAQKVQEAAVRVHQAVGCRIWSRSDFLVAGTDPVWIEVNTIPGMTQTSLYPQAAAAAGISYSELVSLFIEAAMAERS